jgi:hypothetical protein
VSGLMKPSFPLLRVGRGASVPERRQTCGPLDDHGAGAAPFGSAAVRHVKSAAATTIQPQ